MPKINKIKVILTLTEIGYRRFKSTPTFANMLHENQRQTLKVGDNELIVNHYIWNKLNMAHGWDPNNIQIRKA